MDVSEKNDVEKRLLKMFLTEDSLDGVKILIKISAQDL